MRNREEPEPERKTREDAVNEGEGQSATSGEILWSLSRKNSSSKYENNNTRIPEVSDECFARNS